MVFTERGERERVNRFSQRETDTESERFLERERERVKRFLLRVREREQEISRERGRVQRFILCKRETHKRFLEREC